MIMFKFQWWKAALASLPMACTAGLVQAQTFSDGHGSISQAEVRMELDGAPPGVREQMNREQMERFIGNVLTERRLEGAAKAAGAADLPQVKAGIMRATREIVARAYMEGEVVKLAASLPDLTELARERYMGNLAAHVVPEGIRVSHILFTVNDEEEAKREVVVKARAAQVLKQLREGADFTELAKEHSEDPGSKRAGGEIRDWSDKGRFVPPFEEAAYALKPGEVSDLVRTRFGYHIIKLHEKRDARQKSFEEVKAGLVSALRQEFLGNKRAEWMKQFQGDKPVELDDATLEALKKP
ncbi:MAG: peptidylprolyl isomerase [Thiobacillus sp.]|nr:peptidylprolyl isomerase [Thiobacillus sp.]MDP2979747.1 peptidylprolyl isomerase [Thiobacillus sp.]